METTKPAPRVPVDFTNVERHDRRFTLYLGPSDFFKIEKIVMRTGLNKAKVLRLLVKEGLKYIKY